MFQQKRKFGEYYKGHTKNYLYVEVKSNDSDLENKIVKVKIEGTENELLLGNKE